MTRPSSGPSTSFRRAAPLQEFGRPDELPLVPGAASGIGREEPRGATVPPAKRASAAQSEATGREPGVARLASAADQPNGSLKAGPFAARKPDGHSNRRMIEGPTPPSKEERRVWGRRGSCQRSGQQQHVCAAPRASQVSRREVACRSPPICGPSPSLIPPHKRQVALGQRSPQGRPFPGRSRVALSRRLPTCAAGAPAPHL